MQRGGLAATATVAAGIRRECKCQAATATAAAGDTPRMQHSRLETRRRHLLTRSQRFQRGRCSATGAAGGGVVADPIPQPLVESLGFAFEVKTAEEAPQIVVAHVELAANDPAVAAAHEEELPVVGLATLVP